MKLVPVVYFGFTALDRRFSSPMLPWIVSEIRKRDFAEKISLGVEDGTVQAYNQDFELQFSHIISRMIRFSQADLDACTFLYLLRDDDDKLLYCYLFQAQKTSDVTDLYKQMRDQNHVTPSRSSTTGSNLTSLCVDISPSLSNFFEVLYIGKIKVWQKHVPDSFIDDALEKFKQHDIEKHQARLLGNIGRLKSEDVIRRPQDASKRTPSPLQRSLSTSSNLGLRTPDVERAPLTGVSEYPTKEESPEGEENAQDEDKENFVQNDVKLSKPDLIQLKTSGSMEDHNRTMVLQVDRTDLRLISPDRKIILLHKHYKDVSISVQGQTNSDHFGFIARDSSTVHHNIGYIFKCESSSVASDAVAAINQAFCNPETKSKSVITSCDHCPMVWFHKLCAEIEHMTDRKTQAAILRRIEQMDEEEQSAILAKYRGAETDSVREQNEFLMMLLRAHCESKQIKHTHDTVEHRSEFLNHYLGGGTIFMKAKRSLSNSLEILKRKASRDDFGASLKDINLVINREPSPLSPAASIAGDQLDRESEGGRSRSSTIGSQSDVRDALTSLRDKKSVSPDRVSEKSLKSPMMDIFKKVGSHKYMMDDNVNNIDAGSWRQAIFKRVMTSNKQEKKEEKTKTKTKEDYRALWRKSIKEAILLIRMEKENARIKAKQEESAVKRIKLEYDEMKPTQREIMEVWEMIANKDNRLNCDNQMLLQAIKQGVPRGKRGEVWQFLADQYSMKVPPVDPKKFPNYNVPYETLLKQLTAHQHAILIDLGRTFPNHSYFSSPLGPGQLALFNLLKAYSLLDPEVGYCQGLSFVVGVLLLHMEESKAFSLLRHLMFLRGLREQYLPNMVGLQVKLYQLSRLLHDQIPDLYQHFDAFDVAPTLYAAPWILTIFASQFPLGFVTRVFDLIFLEGSDVVFRVALALLMHNKDELLACDGFEEIMNCLKDKLSEIDKPTLDKIMKYVYTSDIGAQLTEFKVEYMVLQEETNAVHPYMEQVKKLEAQNRALTSQNKDLVGRLDLALANVQRLEKCRALHQSQINKLEMQTRGLDVTVVTLGAFVAKLIEDKIDVEIPDDVRRIVGQISFNENKKSVFQRHKPMVKSLSTGRIALGGVAQDSTTRSNSLTVNEGHNLVQKNSNFFSSCHNQMLHNFDHSRVNVTIQEMENEMNMKNDVINNNNGDSAEADSGLGTPSSPKNAEVILENESHPLSNCGVDFTFSGTRELKSVKDLRNVRNLKNFSRNSSPDLLGK